MTETFLFDSVAEALERHSSLSRLEARGVLRLTLQKIDLDPKTLTEIQVFDLVGGTLVRDLEGRGIRNAAAICKAILADFEASHPGAALPDPGSPPARTPVVGEAPTTLFDWTAEALEHASNLNRLSARGTLRLVLKDAGFSPEMVTKEQMAAALAQVMPKHLRRRGVADADAVCSHILGELPTAVVSASPAHDTPGEIFLRLGRT